MQTSMMAEDKLSVVSDSTMQIVMQVALLVWNQIRKWQELARPLCN